MRKKIKTALFLVLFIYGEERQKDNEIVPSCPNTSGPTGIINKRAHSLALSFYYKF